MPTKKRKLNFPVDMGKVNTAYTPGRPRRISITEDELHARIREAQPKPNPYDELELAKKQRRHAQQNLADHESMLDQAKTNLAVADRVVTEKAKALRDFTADALR